jgi:glyoxylase-like metal-dependent hydrolase (beta-lactamase superfamily II)
MSTATPEADALRRARDAGIHLLPVPTPFAIGEVNTYLLEGDPLVLVDCGPNAATVLESFEELLARTGHAVADIGVIVVTHQHIDHIGLAGTLARRSGAEVWCLDLLAGVLEEWERHAVQDDDDAQTLMLRHGVERHVADALRAVADNVRPWGAPAPVHRTLAAGETVTLGGRDLEVLHRPGHSPSDTVLYDRSHRLALCGDHLLAGISSNAVISRPLRADWDGRRPQPLLEYRASLRATRELELDVALGGHGVPVTDHRALIDERLARQDDRALELLALLGDGPRSAHELATAMFGEVAITQTFLTLSEVLGHLDLLIEDGVVAEDRSADVVRFGRI